jgi:hypothetical protein
VGPTLAAKINSCNDASFRDFMIPSIDKTLFLEPVCEEEIVKITYNFKNKKSCDNDNINMTLVKTVIHCIKIPLTNICNKSIQSGIFPDGMKKAKVVPIFKSGDQKEVSNYRPVSILPQFSKILEKIFYNRLIKFISRNNPIYKSQYGFRENHSTSLAIMELVEDLSNSFDKIKITAGVFIDLKMPLIP